MSDKGNPYQNDITESFFKTLKYNEVNLNDYDSFEEAYGNIENFIEVAYKKKRLHSSLSYLPPAEFEEKILAEQQKQLSLENQSKNDARECSQTVFQTLDDVWSLIAESLFGENRNKKLLNYITTFLADKYYGKIYRTKN